MASLLAGDDIISDRNPARLMVVDRPENLPAVRDALAPYGTFLKVDICPDLQAAVEQVRAGAHDVVLLALELPDSWPADTYHRFRQTIGDLPVLVLARGDDADLAARRASRPPFCIIDMNAADPAHIRRLVVSACLFGRAGGRPQSRLSLAAEPS